MPHRSYRNEEPLYGNISNWNDGVEYIPADHNDTHSPNKTDSQNSRSPERLPSRKADKHTAQRPLQRHHTEPSRSDRADRPRRTRYRSPSPPDVSREQHRNHGYDAPPRSHRDAHYPPAARHGRPPLDPSMTSPVPDTRSRQRNRASRSLSSSPPRRREDHHTDRRTDKNAHTRAPARPTVQRSKSTKDSIKGVMNMNLLKNPRLQTAAAAAFAAGSQAAMSTPGAWNGQKGAKIATAALGAAALDAFRKGKTDGGNMPSQTRERHRSPPPKNGGKRGGIEVVGSKIGGFLLDQLANKRKPRN